MTTAVMWFRRDLRLDDLPALGAAQAAGRQGVVPLFVVDPSLLGPAGPNRRRFLAGCLEELRRATDGNLVLRFGDPRQVVPAVVAETGASTVAVTADFGPYGARRDRAVSDALAGIGVAFAELGSSYAVAPGQARAASGASLWVFTAYHRAWEKIGWGAPVSCGPTRWSTAVSDIETEALLSGSAQPGQAGLPDWWEGLPLGPSQALPLPGAKAAADRLEHFVAEALRHYHEGRDLPGREGTSRLSPYLHFGCTHPRTVLESLGNVKGSDRLRSELAWRDFYADGLWHRPASARHAWQPFAEHLRWDTDKVGRSHFRAWALGCTGFPMVDAAMRQLLAEGWVHNRARMVAASFLVKDLHIDWRLGARWFMWHLVDGDLASNQHNWQWVAGTGTDAAPFFRVFNPLTQQERFDPDGTYVRQFVPELRPGAQGYPPPVVDHAAERHEALARFDEARNQARLYPKHS